MSLLLYINGQLADLGIGTVIAQTKQVNDLNSLDNRQTNYTNKFKLPKTANNLRIMQYLTVAGNTSGVPYQKNECSLYSHTGECFVYKGRAVVTDGGDSFEVALYDGIIDLYKAIENKSLADLDLQEINHKKTFSNIVRSWNYEQPYRYILADYNGKSDFYFSSNIPHCNIDYQIPSVSVPWLFNKIFETFGFNPPQGSIFNHDDFTNLWLTFPKGAENNGENDTLVFLCSEINPGMHPGNNSRTYYLPYPAPTTQTGAITVIDNRHLQVSRAGHYRLEFSGSLSTNKNVEINIGRNQHIFQNTNDISNRTRLSYAQEPGVDFTFSKVLNLNRNDTVSIILSNSSGFGFYADGSEVELKLTEVGYQDINFDNAFADFSIKDFLNEIVHRFGLTLFKDKYSNTYSFLTLAELIENAPVQDWSSRFIKKVSEDYINGSYAQRNWLLFNYNDKESTHNDGFIAVENTNLPDSKNLIKSKIYSPERNYVNFINRPTLVYKLWEKEVTQNQDGTQEFKYKPLDKRYYLTRAVLHSGSINLFTDSTPGLFNNPRYYYESFSGLPFTDVIQNYYNPVKALLNKALIVTAQLWLTDMDIVNFDFKQQYYIAQLSGYFIVNKINNYIPGKPTTCELVQVRQDQINPPVLPALQITGAVAARNTITVNYLNEYINPVQLEVSANMVNWQPVTTLSNGNDQYTHTVQSAGTYYLRLNSNGVYSNMATAVVASVMMYINSTTVNGNNITIHFTDHYNDSSLQVSKDGGNFWYNYTAGTSPYVYNAEQSGTYLFRLNQQNEYSDTVSITIA